MGTHAVELVLPAHNEAATIGQTLRELDDVLNRELGLGVGFIVCEDGSLDDTIKVLRSLEQELPLRVLSSPERKGYSRAVVDGLSTATADVVAFMDGDGQCDPADLPALLTRLGSHDVVVGYRHPRRDTQFRKLISGAFGAVYRRLFPVRIADPSCPYLAVRRAALASILEGHPGILRQGFWWEFNARSAAAGLSIAETPVRHRARAGGKTQVYRLGSLPRIALEHLRGLFELRRELADLRRPN